MTVQGDDIIYPGRGRYIIHCKSSLDVGPIVIPISVCAHSAVKNHYNMHRWFATIV